MLSSILVVACGGHDHHVLATAGNLNNHLGVPLTLLRLHEHHRYAVVELGMNHFGEIAYLSQLVCPHIALITQAAPAHLAGVATMAGVARAKGEIFVGLVRQGMAVLNRDDPFFPTWRAAAAEEGCITFGLHPQADVRAIIPEKLLPGENVRVETPVGRMEVCLPLLGMHNVLNMLAATAAAIALDLSLEIVREGLEQVQAAPGRLHWQTLAAGIYVIDDTYNANPTSLAAAVATLLNFPGQKIVVLGDMQELGAEAEQWHAKIGQDLRTAGVHWVFAYGTLTVSTVKTFGKSGYHFETHAELVQALQTFLQPETTVLVKGSRSMHMEKVVQALFAASHTRV